MTSARTKLRKEKAAHVLACLNETDGRARTNHAIAQQCHTSTAFVQRVRDDNMTPEEKAQRKRQIAANMKALDESGIFPGIYSWHMERQA